MNTQTLRNTWQVAAMVAVGLIAMAGIAMAASNSQFQQVILPGTLTTDIRSTATTTVATPTVQFTTMTASLDCQYAGSASTATFGSSTERIYLDNVDAADAGWTLTIAATTGTTATWDSGTTTFDFNDPQTLSGGDAGCADGGGDADSVGGQLTLDPSGGTITQDYTGGNLTGVSLGSSAAFSEGVTDAITLMSAAAGSDDIGRWYLTGVAGSQTIPPNTQAATYTIDFTLTATAL